MKTAETLRNSKALGRRVRQLREDVEKGRSTSMMLILRTWMI